MRLDFPDSLKTILVCFMKLSQREDQMTQLFEALSVKPSICRFDLVSSKIYEPRITISNPYQPHHEALVEHYPSPSK
jgi:hypothetical protein